ncbi:MAG TPA: hypothetical protein VEY09_13640 [Pyrinomonadaceae bacterium]|nr:hypothetical protein [Pyrinomonadaceae bacterium]
MSAKDYAPALTRPLIFAFGFLISFLPLVAELDPTNLPPVAISVFALLAVISLIYAVALIGEEGGAQAKARSLSWSYWVTFSVALLGVGMGILAYIFRDALDYFIRTYVVLNTAGELLLASLLFLGIIMGFFIVRNWSKSQQDFVTSLTAVFGGVFVASLLGELPGIDLLPALAHYAVGFTVSGGINLMVYNWLVREYSTTRSLASRAVIDNLYGSDKAKAIDLYFLKNFEEDTNYARRLLVQTLRQFREKVLAEFARKFESRRAAGSKTTAGGANPLRYYFLIAIRCEPGDPPPPGSAPPEIVEVTFHEVSEEERDPWNRISAQMFRMGVAVKITDDLVYILAAGEYKKPFPIYESVAGLALRSRQVIVMYRDNHKKFRHEGYDEGRCPKDLRHLRGRGLEQIDYLSYVSVPVVSHFGNPEEMALGIINVDTRLFVANAKEEVEKLEKYKKDKDGVITAKIPLSTLTEWATRLYEDDDDAIDYLEEMRAVAVPVLELYLKCLAGTSQTSS